MKKSHPYNRIGSFWGYNYFLYATFIMHRYPAIPPHTAQVIPLKNIICITVSGAILNKNTIIDDNIIVNIAVTSPNTIDNTNR